MRQAKHVALAALLVASACGRSRAGVVHPPPEASAVPVESHADEVEVGINFVMNKKVTDLTDPEQEAILDAMKAAGVRVIRAGVEPDDKNVAFLQRAYAHGMKVSAIFNMKYKEGTPWPHPPAEFKNFWREPALSQLDSELCRSYFQSILSKLEDKGIVLAGIEIGNEINWAGFNADFSLPGEGRVLGGDDLLHDPEGQQVARGLAAYVKVIAAAKDVRDHSKLNKETSILSAGLADLGLPPRERPQKADAVSIPAALAYMRSQGLDRSVDLYGVHTYPPGTVSKQASAERDATMAHDVFAECHASGSSGKPCVLTEWGFGLPDKCPVDDAEREKVVQEMRGYFRQFAREGKLRGFLYYNWLSDTESGKEGQYAAFRCGAVTKSGASAILPMQL